MTTSSVLALWCLHFSVGAENHLEATAALPAALPHPSSTRMLPVIQSLLLEGPDHTPPTVPANLLVIYSSQNSLILKWNASTDNVGVLRYELSLDGNPVGISKSSTFTFVGLQASTSYTLSVSAVDAAGNRSAFKTLTASTNAVSSGVSLFTLATEGSVMSISGQKFSSKSMPAPAYYSNFDADTTGLIPPGQMTNLSAWGTVQANKAHSGSKSLEFNYSASPTSTKSDWQRNAIDLGSAGADKIYVSAWVYLDKGSSTSTSWQWKGFPTITSSPRLYYDLSNSYPSAPPGSYAYNMTAAFSAYWYFDNARWANGAGGVNYYDHDLQATKRGVPTSGLPQDAMLWGQWQRMEFYAQRSSAPNVADGIWRGKRIGKDAYNFNFINALTHHAGNSAWRYVVLSHAIESVYDGYLDLDLFMDDVYVDTTQARLELCDAVTWAGRKHCEIQRATSWSDSKIVASLNKGSFKSKSMAYLYVVDNNGSVNPDGYPYQLP